MTMATVDTLLATTDDFDLCDGVFCALADLMGNTIDAAKEPEPCRTITLVWHAGGIIGNGGFQYLFEGDFNGDPGYRLTALAFQRINAQDAYTAFRDALALFPCGELPDDIDERLRIYQSYPEDRREEIDRQFLSADENTRSLLATYIRSNQNALRYYLTETM